MIDDDAWPDRSEDHPYTAGRWRFVLRGAEVADLTYDGTPVLRAVRFVTRDHDWRTADDTVDDLRVVVDEDAATADVTIDATGAVDGTALVRWRLTLRVEDDLLTATATATVVSAFHRNRIGLVVLHPPALAGLPLTVLHPDGTATDTTYPLWIAPHQPATDVAGYTWTAGSVVVDVRLSGDVFEMEDQRNWTDASFKTYSTPLTRPFPVAVDAGTRIEQAVTVRAAHVRSGLTPAGSGAPRSLRSGVAAERVGRGAVTVLTDVPPVDPAAPEPSGAAAPVLQVLASSAPAADRPADDASAPPLPVLVEPVLAAGDARTAAVLASARRDAGGAPLDVRFVTDDPDALRRAVETVLEGGPVVRVGAFDPRTHGTTPELQAALRAVSAAHGGLEVVAGTRAHFTELNRGIDALTGWDGGLTFSVTPQMHDRTRAQVTESVRMLRWVAIGASRLAAGRPLHIGPVTLRPRFNAVATSDHPSTAEVTDPAQHSAAAAAWFRAAWSALRAPGVASITLGEAWGPRGLPVDARPVSA